MKDHHELAMEQFAKSATWMQQTGGYAKDMTLRDWFAGMAMQGLLHDEAMVHPKIPEFAFKAADAMLKERKP